MMQFFRSIAKPLILVTAIAFFTWLVVDLSGLSGGGGLLTRTSVGKVNGTPVDIRAFQQNVQQAIEGRQRQTGASLGLEEVAQVRNEVWEQYVSQILFSNEYKRYGLRVSDAQVAEVIRVSPLPELMQDPSFQTNGKFDPAKYERWLASPSGQAAIPYLEDRYRDALLQAKLRIRVTSDVYVSDAALWERYRDEHEKARFGVLVVDPATAIPDNAAPVSEQEAQDYYRAHRNDFKRPHAAFLSYLALPRSPDASDTAAALARARALREEISKGTPFAEVARRESSDTVSGKNGGELGELTRISVDSVFAKAAFSLPLKTLSDPVLSGFGFHLIEVESRKGGDSFKARHILVPIEVTGRHRELLDKRADSLEKLAAERLEPSALDTASRALRLRVGTLGPITEGMRIAVPEAGNVPDAGVWAFQAKAGEESPILEGERAFLVFRLDSAQAEGVPPFAQARSTVEQKVRLEKKRVAALALAKQLAGRMPQAGSLRQLAQTGGPGLSYKELGPIARLGASGLPDPALIGAAFGAPKGGIAGPLAAEDGVYLFEGLDRIRADSADFTKNLAQARNEAVTAAKGSRIRAYMTALRAGAKIVDRRADIYKTSAQAAANAPVPVR